ncbi:MAG TPA: GntR family transcriptional regulator [Bryobacteraceae bacterium]|nr:GntR family transcriptional regulator [Bryobacteraceae bacterium]
MNEVIEQKPLTQTVFEKLRGDILHGKLPPGEVIRQDEITTRFGVSRTPVREALQRLRAEGLVTFLPRRKVVVSTIPMKRIRQIYEIRARLEAFAAELAVGRLTAKQLNRLKELTQQMEVLDSEMDLEKILEKNREFHYIIYSAADNELLVSMIDQLWRDIPRLRSQYLLTPNGLRDSTQQHRLILEALAAQDRQRAYDLVRQHCEHSKVALLGDDGPAADRGTA